MYSDRELNRWVLATGDFNRNNKKLYYRKATIAEARKMGFGICQAQISKKISLILKRKLNNREFARHYVRSKNEIIQDLTRVYRTGRYGARFDKIVKRCRARKQ
ncbi:hypothetical protein PGB90_008136 [Kerria lacca]